MKTKFIMALLFAIAFFFVGCTYDTTGIRRLNDRFEENSRNLSSNVTTVIELARAGIDMQFELQLIAARIDVRQHFRGAYIPATAENPASIREDILTSEFQAVNEENNRDFLSDAASFSATYENPDAFEYSEQRDGDKVYVFYEPDASKATKTPFINFHAKVLAGSIVPIGRIKSQYENTLKRYHDFLDSYNPARKVISEQKDFRDSFAELEEALKTQTENNVILLRGYRTVESLKDPFQEILNALPISAGAKKLLESLSDKLDNPAALDFIKSKLK